MRKTKIAVIGGGITGQLVQMQVPSAHIFDWKTKPTGPKPLTRDYGANYLWQPLPGIDCRSFTVQTRIDGVLGSPDRIAAYKAKIHKSNDVNGWVQQFQPEMTGYEVLKWPETTVQYGCRAFEIDRIHHTIKFSGGTEFQYDVLVSTIPLFSLLSLLGMPEPTGRLQHKPIFFKIVARPPDAPFPPDVMYVNYISDPNIEPYRFTDRDGERHYESIVPYTGTISTKRFLPGKIYAHAGVPEILEYLSGFNIQTFGRFGSWSPDELVHDTWAQIEEWKHML